MDSALELRIKTDNGITMLDSEIDSLLDGSSLIHTLTADVNELPLFKIWRLIALSEIPYSNRLEYTQTLISSIYNQMSTNEGFTLTGKVADLLPCYNAMLISALCRLGRAGDQAVESGINWILKYQPFIRGLDAQWKKSAVKKYGGCLKQIPCYIGLSKSVRALIEYSKYYPRAEIKQKIELGVEYILNQKVYQRLSDGEPITNHIFDLSFPESYHLNIVELLQIVDAAGNIKDKRTEEAIHYLKLKRQYDGGWKNNFVYKSKGYVAFDAKGKKGDWVSHILTQIITHHSMEQK